MLIIKGLFILDVMFSFFFWFNYFAVCVILGLFY